MTHRVRKADHKVPLEDFLYRHSPLKKGAVIKNEDKPLSKVDKIMNRIYLGNYQAAKDKQFFKDKNIKAVLNCTQDIPNHFANNRNIEYMRIPVEDSLKERDFELMYKFLPAAVEFIHKHADIQKENVFIHCYAGRQRSISCLAGYLISKHKMTPHEACLFALKKRPEAFHFGASLNFSKSLRKYYKDLKNHNLAA